MVCATRHLRTYRPSRRVRGIFRQTRLTVHPTTLLAWKRTVPSGCMDVQPLRAIMENPAACAPHNGNRISQLAGWAERQRRCRPDVGMVSVRRHGVYPVCPGQPYYAIGSPSLKSLVVNLESGRKFTITARNASPWNIYIQSATLNGQPYDSPFISHSDITAGGSMEFIMGPSPNKTWGQHTPDF